MLMNKGLRLPGLAAAAGTLSLALAPNPVQALVVTVGGTQYEVSTFTGSYNSNLSKFNTAANGGVMPWWGNNQLAVDFSTAVGTSLGLPNPSFYVITANVGPIFAYGFRQFFFEDVTVSASYLKTDVQTYYGYSPPAALTATATYAQATVYAPPPPPSDVPGPLPLFGAAAAFGMSRRLRRRIQLGG